MTTTTKNKPFSQGLWIIPALTFLGFIIFAYEAVRAHNSNSTQQTQNGTLDNTGNVPYTSIGQFWFAVALLVITVVVFFWIRSDYSNKTRKK